MKRIAILLTVLLALALFAGCGNSASGSSADAAESSGAADAGSPADGAPEPSDTAEEPSDLADEPVMAETLIVGLDDTFAPMGFRDAGNNLVGFDIDLATAVGEAMGVEVVFQPIEWSAKEMELEAGNIDCIWNGMSRTPEREESMTLSQDYLNNKIIIMTVPEVEITSKEQLAQYQVGTQAKSSALEVIQGDDVFSSIEANLFEYNTYDECILDMQAGRIQVMIVDEVLGQYKNNNLETKFNVATVDFGEDLYTIGFRKGDDTLCGQVEAAMKEVIASGKGAEISQKWFGENLLLDIQ